MFPSLPPSWQSVLTPEFDTLYWSELITFVGSEYANHVCFPLQTDIFRAFELTLLDDVKVVILGQDPYHTPGAAMGLSFSIPV
jgi:uracil-DNA glycosylase